VVESAELPLIYVSVNTAKIWKPPKQAAFSSSQLVI